MSHGFLQIATEELKWQKLCLPWYAEEEGKKNTGGKP